MKRLERITLVQFYLFEAEEIEVGGNTAWLGPNGAGKTSTLDAVQIALLGAHQGYLKFNTQSTSTSQRKNFRSIRDYCLGTTRAQGAVVIDGTGRNAEEVENERRNAAAVLARDTADTYITLVFRDVSTGDPITVGVSLQAQKDAPSHTVKGLYILPGLALGLNDHIETVKDETVPLRWKDFEHSVAAKCAAAGRTPMITDKAETYIGELLHQLQPRGKGIDVREFLKAFKRSVMLRDIESVNDFVRDFVVEEHPIDKHKAIAQIEHFRLLDNLVQQTKEQIKNLKEFSVRYDKIAADHREIATMDYLVAHYQHEHLALQQGELQDAIETETRDAGLAAADASRLGESVGVLRSSIETKQRELDWNPATRQLSDLNATVSEAQKARAPHQRALDGLRHLLASAFERMNAISGFVQTRPACEGMAVRLDEFAKQARLDTDEPRQILSDAIDLIETNKPWVVRECGEAEQAANDADEKLRSVLATLKAADKHGVSLGANTSRAIEVLEEHGVKATPVCSLVRVKQVEWQPAIEAFLARNRESLVIAGGRERDAVRILRNLPEGRRIYDVTIVQPEHLKQASWSDPDKVLVGSLIEGDNEVAVSYLRMLFGKTRMVETEDELERYSRSLTVDGMLSANGGTRQKQPVRPELFMIGTRITDSGRDAIRRKIEEATREHGVAVTYRDSLVGAKSAVEKLGDPGLLRESIASTCGELKRLGSNIADIEEQIAALPDDGGTKFLSEAIAAARERLKVEEGEHQKAGAMAVACGTRAAEKQRVLDALTPSLDAARKALDQASAHPDFESEIVQRVMNEHDALEEFTIPQRVADCTQRRSTAFDRVGRRLNSIAPDFDRYLTGANVTLIDERKDWRKARDWVLAESVRLEDTQLAQFEEEVELAKAAAEKAFREDVAVRISERIQQTETNLKTLNKTLAACPPFSNGERYEFEARPAAAYKNLYTYITEASRGVDLFSGDSTASKELIDYLKKSADPETSKVANPLDDYRLLFNFDLKILQNGAFLGRLSQRVGPGSNGEHRTPFYVIAGAALASAYRIRPGEDNTGAALMLLDEAFHGMDSQNSLAAARFLKGLGLQLLIAAPDSELGKLAPICDSVYELIRFGNDVFMEATIIKEAAHALMTSDMPAENPQLLLDKIAQIEGAA